MVDNTSHRRPEAITQVRDVKQADQIREAISLVTGKPENDIDIRQQGIADQAVLPDDDPDVVAGMDRLAELRKREKDVPEIGRVI